MRPVDEREIRASFVNCSKGEAKRLFVPGDLAERPWDDLDLLGWRDPGAPQRAYAVAPLGDDLVGVALRVAAGQPRRTMCSLCLTTHPPGGVLLMTARRAGRAGQGGDSVGAYLCADLACSLYVRDLRRTAPGARLRESLPVEARIARSTDALTKFLTKVTA